MKVRPHVVFVDHDETELATFRRLYEGDRFQVTTVCAQFPRSALPAIEQALGQAVPDLFLLDLFFLGDDGSADASSYCAAGFARYSCLLSAAA